MKKLNLKEIGWINAGPSCGKSTLIAEVDRLNNDSSDDEGRKLGWLVDSDWFLFSLMGSKLKEEIESAFNPVPWKSQNDPSKLLWKVSTRLVVSICTNIVTRRAGTVITNLTGEVPPVMRVETATIFREPESAAKIMAERAIASGDTRKFDYRPLTESWFKSWRTYNKYYDTAIVLEDDEFLGDVFGFARSPLTVEEVKHLNNNACREFFDEFGYDVLLNWDFKNDDDEETILKG